MPSDVVRLLCEPEFLNFISLNFSAWLLVRHRGVQEQSIAHTNPPARVQDPKLPVFPQARRSA